MTRKLPLLIGSLSLVLVLVFGSIFVIRAAQKKPINQEPVFERIDAAQTEPSQASSESETLETKKLVNQTNAIQREPNYYFDEDVYLSRKLKDVADKDLVEEETDQVLATQAPLATFRSTGRYRQTTVVAHFRQDADQAAGVHRELWAGEEVFEISSNDEWSRVRDVDGVEGYVASHLLVDLVQATLARTVAPTTVATAAPTTAPTVAYVNVNRTRYVRNGVVNVRTSDSVYSLIITELPVGSRVTEIGVGPEWSKVRLSDGRTGYVLSSLLSATSGVTTPPTTAQTPAPTSPPTTPPTSPPTTPAYTAVDKTQYINVSSVNVRASGSTSASVLSQLYRGNAVRVTGVGSSWVQVSLSSGQTGYIYKSLLSDTKPALPTPAPTTPPTSSTSTPSSSVSFVHPGSVTSAVTNFNKIKPYLSINGDKTYYSFSDNGNNTITVDGLTLPYQSVQSYGMTHYDGVAVSVAMGENPVRNRNTATGIPAQRGLIAMKLPAYGGLPFGTVVFVEGYGLAVLADRGWLSSKTQVDLCYNGGESSSVRSYGWAMQRMYVISTP